MFKNIRFSASTSNIEYDKLFNQESIKKSLDTLPEDFFQKLLKSGEKNTQILYLLLVHIKSDTIKLIDFIDYYLDENTELDAKAFLNTTYGTGSFFFQSKIKSAFLYTNSRYYYDYTIRYITPSLNNLISISKENDGITAGNPIDFFVYYKKRFKKIDSQETFLHELKSSYEILDELISIDIALVKGFSFLPVLDKLLKADYIPSKVKLCILDYELHKKQDAEVKKKLEKNVVLIYLSNCTKIKTKAAENKEVSEKIENHTSIIEFLCTSNTPVADSLLVDAQEKLCYDWSLFFNAIKNNKNLSKPFFTAHLDKLYENAEGLFTKKVVTSIYDTSHNIYNHGFYNINRFFPFINYQQYYRGISYSAQNDDLVKSLFISQKFYTLIEDFVFQKLNIKYKSLSSNEIKTLSNSNNALLATFGYSYILKKRLTYLHKVARSNKKSDILFLMAELYEYSDSKRLLARYFKNTVSAGFTNGLCNNKFDNAAFIHSAVNYFTNNQSKTSLSALKEIITDSLNCMKTNLFILTKIPTLISNFDKFNEAIKFKYFEIFCSYVKRKEWSPIFLYLNSSNLKDLKNCYAP